MGIGSGTSLRGITFYLDARGEEVVVTVGGMYVHRVSRFNGVESPLSKSIVLPWSHPLTGTSQIIVQSFPGLSDCP